MAKIKITKDIFVRDHFKVRRRAWMAGDEVESHVYSAVLRTNEVVNPEDLPVAPTDAGTPSLNTGTMQNKMLPEDTPTLEEQAIAGNVPEEKEEVSKDEPKVKAKPKVARQKRPSKKTKS